jgi:DNA-directed RNA polymerase specialized sigma24 family protein
MNAKKIDPQLSEISKKLDVLMRLSAINITKGLKFKQQVAVLSDTGFQPRKIADMLGTTANTVSVTLHEIRKERKEKESKEETSPKGSGETVGAKSKPEVVESAEKT